MDSGAILITTFFGGYVLQWARGFKRFGDGATLLAAIAGGVLASFMVLTASDIAGKTALETFQVFAVPTFQNALVILGGTFTGHVAAQSRSPVKLAPKFSEFGK